MISALSLVQLATMPVFKVHQEQPGLPSRSSSVPPMHLHSPNTAHTLPPAACLPSLAEQCTPKKPSKPTVFAWVRLPQHIQQGILVHALLPDGPDTPIFIGLPRHRAHLNTTAVPIFLALGSWEAYANAASVFYQHIQLDLSLFPAPAMIFLTSPATLRPRSLVTGVQLHFTIKEHLPLFDTGYTVSQSMGKLIKMNIPTALRGMKTHGRLSEVELLILGGSQVDLKRGGGNTAPAYYLPMARLQLAGWTPVAEPAEVVVAPAFLACRAFQSGLLPLLEDGAFEDTRLALQHVGDATDADIIEDENSTAAHQIDRNAFVQHWLGATVLELLDTSLPDQIWADPFPVTEKCGGDADEMMVDLAWPSGPETVVQSPEIRHELVSSPIKYPTSSSSSDTDSSRDEVLINFGALRDGSLQEENPELDDDNDKSSEEDTSSEDSSSSEEAVCELHKSFGVTRLEHRPTDRPEQGNGLASSKEEGSPPPPPSSSSDDSDDSDVSDVSDESSPSSAAMHLEIARTELITNLTSAVGSDDTMEAIARASADRQLTSYATTEGPCKHGRDTVPGCPSCGALSEDSSESTSDDEDIPRTPLRRVPPANSNASFTDLGKATSGPLHGDDEADSDTDTDTESSSSSGDPVDEHANEVSPADLSHIEEVFGARAKDDPVLDVCGGSIPTNCILTSMVSGSERAQGQPDKGKRAVTVEPVGLGLDNNNETRPWRGDQSSKSVATDATDKTKTQAGTKSGKTSSPQTTTTPTTPAHHASDSKPLTPVSARSKGPVKSKGTQTKGLPNMPARVSHPQAERARAAVAANNNRVSRKRKALPPAAANDETARSSKANRRKRARAFKEKQLRLARRFEAEAAEREKALVS